MAGAYCAACGQRAPRADDFTVRRFARTLWNEISGSDSRLWRTLRAIFVPGALTRAHLGYRWRDYIPPLRLYLIVSGVFFLLAWDPYFQTQAQELRAAGDQVPPVLRTLYQDPASEQRVSDWTAIWRVAGVLAMGLWVALLHRRERLPVGAHLVFATHYYCADFAMYTLFAPILALSPAHPWVGAALTFLGLAWLLVWSTLAVHRVYARSVASSVARGVAIVLMDVVLSVLAGQFAVVTVLLTHGKG